MNHRGYTGRWTGTYEITLRMYIAVNNELSKLQMIDAFRELVPYSQTLSQQIAFDAYFEGHEAGSRYAWHRAGKEDEPPGYGEGLGAADENADPAMVRDVDKLEATTKEYGGLLSEMLDRLERDLGVRAFSLWAGYSAFCDECVGVAAEKVIAVVVDPAVERIENLKSLAEHLELEADTETVEEIRDGLRESWRVVEKRGV
jgi:hypothetical protein